MIRLTGQSRAQKGKNLPTLVEPEEYKSKRIGARVEIEIHPAVEMTNSKRRKTLALPSGLKKKKSGKVAITSQYTKKFIAAITFIENSDRSIAFEIFTSTPSP